MLNFGGQTRRRVINLGTKNRSTTKKSILQRAEQERKKRAENRQKEEAVRTIQRYIRRRSDLKRLLTTLGYENLTVRQQLAQLIVFKSKLLDFGVSESNINNLLFNIQESCQLYNGPYINNALIDLISHLQTELCLRNLLKDINLKSEYLNMDVFINTGLIPFLKNISKVGGLSQNNADILCQFLVSQKTSISDSWLINIIEKIKPDYLIFF